MQYQQLDQLLLQSGRGDTAAFQKLYDAAAPQLLGIARRLLRDHHQAEDVLQHGMIAAWTKAREFNPEQARATTWLTSIVRHRAIDVLRQHGKQTKSLREDQDDILTALGQDAPHQAADPISNRVSEKLNCCLAEMDAQQVQCIQLAYLDGCTFREIAVHVSRPIGSVKSLVQRGLKKLRDCLEQ